MAYNRKRSRSAMTRRRRAPMRRRRMSSYRKKSRVPRTLKLKQIPNRMFIGLDFGYQEFLQLAASTNRSLQMRSAKNPLAAFTTSGSEPQGFDQWKTLYKWCRVVGIKYHWTITSQGGTTSILSARCYWNSETALQDIVFENSNRYAKIRDLTGTNRAVIKGYVKPWVPLGISRTEYMTNPMTRQNATDLIDPGLLASGWFVIRNLGTTASTFNTTLRAKVYFEFTNPISLRDVA